MTPFENLLETILEEYARRDSEGEFDTWEETDAFVKEKAEVLLAYVKEEPVSNITGIKSKHAEGKLKKCIESITEESLAKARKQLEEESVSGGLEEEIKRYLQKVYDRDDTISDVARHFANWQKEQFEKNRLAHCDALTEEQAQIESDFVAKHLKENNRTPTFIDAIEYGMKLQKEQFEKDCTDLCNGIATAKGIAVAMAYDKGVADTKEQMMAKAIDVEVKVDAGGYPYIDRTIELYDYYKDMPLAKEGDRYKVVLIKEG